MPMLECMALQSNKEGSIDLNKLAQVYSKSFNEFGEKFDKLILEDLSQLGYECTEVGLTELEDFPGLKGLQLLTMYVQEKDLRTKSTQITMSQGMYRALGLVIHLNHIILSRDTKTLLIDDIGEGLDFERSKSFVSLLIKKAEAVGLQLVMTTNDRFVMNDVDLKKWAIIVRNGHKVQVTNYKSSPEVFEQFELIGLNNFDFFAMDLYRPESLVSNGIAES